MSSFVPSRLRRGYTLAEIIVTLLIVSIVAGIGWVSYRAVIERAEDRANESHLAQVMRGAQGFAALREDPWAVAGDVEFAASDVPSTSAGATDGHLTASIDNREPGDAGTPGGWSWGTGVVSYAVGSSEPLDAGSAEQFPMWREGVIGSAMRSPTGHCSFALSIGVSEVQTWTVREDLEAACSGLMAFKGPNGNYVPLPADEYGAQPAPTGLVATPEAGRIRLVWSANPSPAVVGYQVWRDGAPLDGGLVAVGGPWEFSDTTVASGTSYTYHLTALDTNGMWGMDSPQVTVLSRPFTPANFAAEPNLDGTVDLSWDDVAGTVTGYRVHINGNPVAAAQVPAGTTAWTHESATGATRYSYQVSAYNASGPSAVTAAIEVLTLPVAPSPLTVTADDASVLVSWGAVTGEVDGYRVYLNGDLHAEVGPSETETLVGSLTNGVAYDVEVAAFNSTGDGPRVGPITAVPFAVPNQVTGVVATPGNGAVTLNWDELIGTVARPLTGYRVYIDGVAVPAAQTTGTSVTISGLTNGQAYSFQVAGYNAAGNGLLSNAVVSTPRTVPGAPTGASATPGNGSATVSFAAPLDNGGATITYYTVTSSPGGHTATGAASPITVGGLTNGTAYTFTVTAHNVAGASAPTAPAGPVTPLAPPAAPTNMVVTPGDSQATLTFTAATATTGAPVTGYRIYVNGVLWGQSGASPVTLSPLTNGQTYSVQIASYNALWNSALSAPMVVTPYGTPGAPSGLTAIGGDQEVALSWNAVGGTSGAPVLGYRVYVNGVYWAQTASPSFLVTGLTNGVPYSFQVAAYNAASQSALSAAQVATPLRAPDAPTNLVATPSASANQVTLSWDPAALAAVYNIYRWDSGWVLYATSTGTSWVDNSVNPSTIYYYQVAAANSKGESPRTPTAEALTRPAVPAPTISINGGTSYTSSWSPIGTATNYEVRVERDGVGVVRNITTANASDAVTASVTSARYRVQVRSQNATGWSDWSAWSAWSAYTTPTTPTGASFTTVGTSYRYSWGTSIGASSYEAQRNIRALANSDAWAGYTNYYTGAATTADTAHRGYHVLLRVRACNSSGCSPYTADTGAAVDWAVPSTWGLFRADAWEEVYGTFLATWNYGKANVLNPSGRRNLHENWALGWLVIINGDDAKFDHVRQEWRPNLTFQRRGCFALGAYSDDDHKVWVAADSINNPWGGNGAQILGAGGGYREGTYSSNTGCAWVTPGASVITTVGHREYTNFAHFMLQLEISASWANLGWSPWQAEYLSCRAADLAWCASVNHG